MTTRTTRLVPKQLLAADGRASIEAVRWRFGRAQAELVIEQGRQLRRDQVRRLRDREANSRIAEAAVATHLPDADVAVPVGDGSITGECLEADSLQSEDRRNHDRQRRAVEPDQVRSVE